MTIMIFQMMFAINYTKKYPVEQLVFMLRQIKKKF